MSNLQQVATNTGVKQYTLWFVIDGGGCRASWNGDTSIPADTVVAPALASLRAAGGEAIVSFGGAAGTELALGCSDANQLATEYEAVIQKYKAYALDFDVEGAAVSDQLSIDRRNRALATLQTTYPGLVVSYTLPVSTSGLGAAELNLLSNAKAHGVKVSVVNIMTMDFWNVDPNQMAANAIAATNATIAQLAANGISSSVGITPMIGVNDVQPQVFTLADATSVTAYAQAQPVVTRLTMWAVERDRQCATPTQTAVVTCSGIAQNPYDFMKTFGAFH